MQKIFRAMIIIAMLITAYLMLLAWQEDYPNQPTKPTTTTAITTNSTGDFTASTTTMTDGDFPTPVVPVPVTPDANVSAPVDKLISVSTDMYDIKIDPKGGDLVYAALKQYNATLDSEDSFVLLENNSNRTYVAQSELINLGKTGGKRTEYSYSNDSFAMGEGDSLSVPLTYTEDGVTVTKTFTFTKGKYPIEVSYKINNASTQAWQGQLFAQLKRDNSDDPGMEDKGPLSMATYLGGAWGTAEGDYNKLKFDEFDPSEKDAKPLNSTSAQDTWVAIVQHYFVSAWTPNGFTAQFFSKTKDNNYMIGFNSQPFIINAGAQQTLSATLYAGPKVQTELAEVANGLNKTVDYGALWPIAKLLFALLDSIHKVIGNWGWAIACLTLIVKLALMWMSAKGYYSMAKMRAIAPKLQALKDEHGDDRMAMSQAMMQLYKDEKVSPMAGCMPMLLQMPIFLALYWVLVESVELRHAPWMFWIQDLSAMDSLFILPALMGVSMFIQQMLNPQPTDPMQAKVMKILPIVFTVMMMFFPAGLVLYWTINNIFSMSQQYYINKKVEKEYAAREAAAG